MEDLLRKAKQVLERQGGIIPTLFVQVDGKNEILGLTKALPQEPRLRDHAFHTFGARYKDRNVTRVSSVVDIWHTRVVAGAEQERHESIGVSTLTADGVGHHLYCDYERTEPRFTFSPVEYAHDGFKPSHLAAFLKGAGVGG